MEEIRLADYINAAVFVEKLEHICPEKNDNKSDYKKSRYFLAMRVKLS